MPATMRACSAKWLWATSASASCKAMRPNPTWAGCRRRWPVFKKRRRFWYVWLRARPPTVPCATTTSGFRTQSERVARIARAGFRVAGEDRQGADSDRVGHRSPRRQKTYLGAHVLSRLCAGGNGHGRSRLARGESDAAGYRICGHRTAADSAVGRRSQSHRLQSGRQPGKAEAQGQVRKGRDGAHWRGSVRHLYGRSRRRERRSRDVESDGHDFWPVDSGGIGIWAGGESRVAARAAPKGASEFGGFAVSLKRYPDTKQRLRSAEPKILDSAAGRRGKPRLYTRR